MSRLTSFINEKVSKKEINEVLTATDVVAGAEFEIKLNEDLFHHLMDEYDERVRYSEEYDRNYEEWEDELAIWKEEKNNKRLDFDDMASKKFLIIDDDYIEYADNLMKAWEEDNPEPFEPEMPNDYVSKWNRRDAREYVKDALDFDVIEDIVVNQLKRVPGINSINVNEWEIHEDSSLEGLAAEIVSPPMSLQDFLKFCPKIFDLINDIGFTDDECGLHIGMSLPGRMNKVDITKLILFTDENYIWKKFSGREVNNYVIHMQETIREEMWKNRISLGTQSARVDKISKLKKMIKESDMDLDYVTSHYQGINAEHLTSSNPYIEFRYMGGSNYHNKWNDVKNVIAQYAFNLKLSCDPNFKKKEYIAKCTRILNKLEAWAVMNEIELVKNNPEKYDNSKQYLRNLERKLQFLPKLTDKEKHRMTYLGA